MARKKTTKEPEPEYVITIPDGDYTPGDVVEGIVQHTANRKRTAAPIRVIIKEIGITESTGIPYLVVRVLGDPRHLTRLNTTPPVFSVKVFGP
jgi:hypothetical protein